MHTAGKRQNTDAIPTCANSHLLLCLLLYLLFISSFKSAQHALFWNRRKERQHSG